MVSLLSATPAERKAPRQAQREAATERAAVLVVSFGEPAAVDYADFLRGREECDILLAGADEVRRRAPAPASVYLLERSAQAVDGRDLAAVVVFLGPRLTDRDRSHLDELFRSLTGQTIPFVGIVSSFRAHLDERDAGTEPHALRCAARLGVRPVVFRPGLILSRNSEESARLRRWGCCYPLVPGRLRSCFVQGDELFAAIESERQAARPPLSRVLTLLGPNRPWREVMKERRAGGLLSLLMTAVCAVLALLCVGHLAALVLDLLARRRPALRRWNFDTLRPRSVRELLALVNRHNRRHVKVVGYNNGVVHFGHRYQGKTVVSTVFCDRVTQAGGGLLKADCGATVRAAREFLAHAGQELPVVPNYSYVCLGTAFFIPIHGSASDCSTVADTIDRVVLYDPASDRLIAAARGEPAFREHAYNLNADVLLLRLYLRVKPRTRYAVRRQEVENPSGEELIAALQDVRSTNVEIRKARAAGSAVSVSKYYKAETATAALELPRDSLGSLWDRLEENPVTSFLMHALTRHFAYHTELFFTAEDFARFWATHRELPLRKIQLRYIRRDGLPQSPFRDHDCVSADLFLMRRHRRRFEAYLANNFPAVRTNPGKHSR